MEICGILYIGWSSSFKARMHNLTWDHNMKFLVCYVCLVLGCGNVMAADRLVFAHYMLWAPSSTDNIDGFKSEIQYAQNKGIDAFALNTHVWTDVYRQRADKIYQAAQELGSGFKLFFSLDMSSDSNGFLSTDNIKEMLTRYANSSSQLQFNGKQFISSWLGNDKSVFSGYSSALEGWKNGVFEPTGGKSKYFFLPFFPTGGSKSEVSQMLSDFSSILDGLYAWDTSAWPYFNGDFQNPSDSKDQAYLSACNDAGKSFMASISPWFFKLQDCCSSACTNPSNQVDCGCQVKGNYKGPGLWLTRWRQLIANPPPFLEIVTWSDWVERSYVAPINNPSWGPQDSNDLDFPHQAFLELGSHYIQWFKTGSEPSLHADSLYIFYYSHSKSATATSNGSCRVQNADTLDDKVYVTTMLTAAAQVSVGSGNSAQTFNVGPSITTVSISMQEGQQKATLTRNGAQLLQVVGKKLVSNTISKYDFNVYSDFAKG